MPNNQGEPTVTSPQARAEFREQILDFARDWLNREPPWGDATALNRWAEEAQVVIRLLIHSVEVAHHQLEMVS